jgi:hypothetical protein
MDKMGPKTFSEIENLEAKLTHLYHMTQKMENEINQIINRQNEKNK